MVPAAADVSTGVETRAPLPDDDIAGDHRLTTIAFDAKALGLGIAAVTCTAACLLVCHL